MINPNDCDFKSRKSKESHFIEHKKLDKADHENENIEADIFRCSEENNILLTIVFGFLLRN